MLSLLTRGERRKLLVVLLAVIGLAVMETVGIGSILPFLSVVSRPEVVETNAQLRYVYELFGFGSVDRFIVILGIGVVVFLVARNLTQLATKYILVRYSLMRQYSLARRLLSVYLNRPYVFFLNKNSSELSRNILSEANEAVNGFLKPLLEFISRLVVVVFICGLLVAVNPVVAVFVTVFLGGFYGLVHLLVRAKLTDLGRKRLLENRRRFRAVWEALGGIKDVKLLGKERVFLDAFSRPAQRIARYNTARQLIGMTPRYVLETLVFGGLMIVVLGMFTSRESMAEAIPVLGVYAFAAYRLMPSLQQLFQNLAKARSSQPVVELLYDEFTSVPGSRAEPPKERRVAAMPLDEEVRLRDVVFRYPQSDVDVLNVPDLQIEKNTTVGFVGPTGSGKTTAVDLILGLLRPTTGALEIDGNELSDRELPRWQQNLGYVPQHIYLSDDSIAQNIAFGIPPDEMDPERVRTAAQIANLSTFIEQELPNSYDTIVGERGIRLSGGQRQRIGIARAVYHDPAVLVMDEATSALDTITETAVMRAIENLTHKKTIIIIAHRITTVRDCDKIFMLEQGRVVAEGHYEELITSNSRFREMAKIKS